MPKLLKIFDKKFLEPGRTKKQQKKFSKKDDPKRNKEDDEYVCKHGCEYKGTYNDVEEHEESCNYKGPDKDEAFPVNMDDERLAFNYSPSYKNDLGNLIKRCKDADYNIKQEIGKKPFKGHYASESKFTREFKEWEERYYKIIWEEEKMNKQPWKEMCRNAKELWLQYRVDNDTVFDIGSPMIESMGKRRPRLIKYKPGMGGRKSKRRKRRKKRKTLKKNKRKRTRRKKI